MSESAAQKPNDLVITYVAGFGGTQAQKNEDYIRLQKALEEGYRVVDFNVTPTGAGGASTTIGACLITVLLQHPGAGSSMYAKHKA